MAGNKDTVTFEVKVQTVIYEDGQGKISKYYHTTNERLNLVKAEEELKELGITINMIIRVLTERAFVTMDRQTFYDSITSTERYYKNN